jgi:Transglycosylase SLT domain
MLVDPSGSAAGSTVTGAIRQASQATGTSFNYLLATAQVESGLNPQAGAPTSSARGLFQFVEQTWLGTIKQSGAALGYGRYADAITRTASGHYQVDDPIMRSEILKLRNDPTANAVMAGAFTRANAAILTNKLGRAPSEGELYVAHFLGAGGAARLITLAGSSPSARAADFFGHAARANASIFYNRVTGAARSLAQVRNVLTARYGVARSNQGPPTGVAQAASEPAAPAATATAAAPVPDTAGITGVFAAAAPPVPPMRVPDTTPAAAGPGNAVAAATATAAGAGNPATPAGPAGNTAAPPVAVSNKAAAPAPKQVAENRQIFHGLFQDSNGPLVASLVSELWTTPALAPGATPPAGQSIAMSLRDLFKDPAPGS